MKTLKAFVRKINQPIVYVDMDGVLCDFEKYFPAKQFSVDNHKPAEILKSIMEKNADDIESFYENLEWLDGGEKIIEFLNNNNIPFSILSSPFLEYDKESIAGKTKWLKNNGLKNIPAIFCKAKEKWRFALKEKRVPNILIDDSPQTVIEWNLCGGKGILHRNATASNTLEILLTHIKLNKI